MLARMLTSMVCLGVFSTVVVQKRIISPELHPDRSVTFRLKAPGASTVQVSLEGGKPLAMTKSEDGIWSATTNPLTPDLYGYTFSVDGVALLDPNNPMIKPNLIYVGNMVLVPGMTPEAWEIQNVPHGEVHHHFYRSSIIGDERDYFVYTPPSYRNTRVKLPVLYLLHGFSDMANGWTEVGKAHVILDNLIAQGKAKPMVVVMTLGYGIPDYAYPGSTSRNRPGSGLENQTKFGKSLLEEVIPAVQKNYRVSNRREDRAIAGLSMGGAEALFIGLNHLETFGSVGAFSSGGLPAAKPEDVFADLDAKKASNLKAFYISCGTDDSLIGFHRGFTSWLKEKGFTPVVRETPGGHVWMNWRRNLIEFCSMIFR